ncbi:MAG: tetratricopeptide repeat protein, partial [Planctomycetes bacterium]|nr:tetratricopeptide repeat protein [Planctomycetota bacterium]
MQRKINLKLVGIVLAGLFILSVAVHFLHGYQVQRNAYRLLERADRASAEKDVDKALTYYALYLTFSPNDFDATQKYAELLDRRGDDGDRVHLILLLEQVLRGKPNEHGLRLRLVHNLIALDRFSEAIDHLKRLQASAADKGEVLHMIGWCQDAKKDYGAAAKSFAEAVRVNPKQLKSYALWVEVLNDRLHRPEEARKALDDLVEANADVYHAYLMRARFARQTGDDDTAAGDLKRAFQLAPDKTEVILDVADAAHAKGNWADAIKLLQESVRRQPNDVDLAGALADLAARHQRFDDAEKTFAQAGDRLSIRLAQCRLFAARGTTADRVKLDRLAMAPDNAFSRDERIRVWRALADAWLRLADAGKADALLREIARAQPKDVNSRSILLDLALQKNQPAQARTWRDELRAIEGESGSLWRYGDAAILVHESRDHRASFVEARKKLAEIDLLRPNWPRVAVLFGVISEREGKSDQAIVDYTRALEQGETGPRVLMSLLGLLVQRGGYAKAETELAKYEQRWALTPEVARFGAEIALGLRDKRYANLAVKRAELTLPARDYRDALWLARIYDAAGETAKAEALLRRSLEEAGHTPDVWVAWMDHLQQANRLTEALKDLERMKKDVSPSRQPLTLARCCEALGLHAEATKAYAEALKAQPSDFITLAYAADFARRADRAEEAQRLYERLLDPALAAPAEYAVPARRHLAVLLAGSSRPRAIALLDANKAGRPETIADQRVRWFLEHVDVATRASALASFQNSLR